MRSAIFRAIYIMGSRLRATPVTGHLRRLEESQWWSPERLRSHQLEQLNSLLRHSYDRSPFYRRLFEEHGLGLPLDSLEELKKLPALDKVTVRNASYLIQNDGLGGRLIRSETSGSTGEPLEFFRDAEWDAQHRAAVARGYGWYGVKPWSRSGLLWGMPSGRAKRITTRLGDILQDRFREKRFDLSSDTLDDFTGRLVKAELLEGYSSMIYELARHINRRGEGGRFQLRLVKGTSEKIFPHYNDECFKAFGRKMRSEYGAGETGIIAFECPEGRMHVNMEHVIAEEEGGEMIATNLLSYSFPFIRYRLGDYVTIDKDGGCPCGRRGPVVKEVTGRAGSIIIGMSGARYPSLTIYYILKELYERRIDLSRAQAVQEEPGLLDFLVILDDRGDVPRLEKELEELVHEQYGADLDFRLRIVESIPREGRKKKDFISRIHFR